MYSRYFERKFFERARKLRRQSNCPKAQTAAVIANNKKEISIGWNACQPEGFSREGKICLGDCPRIKMATTQSYEVCHIIHAETLTILNVLGILSEEILCEFESHKFPTKEIISKFFSQGDLGLLRGAALYLSGHTYACDNCKEMCRLVGLRSILVDPEPAAKVSAYYQGLGRAVPWEPRADLINGIWHVNK